MRQWEQWNHIDRECQLPEWWTAKTSLTNAFTGSVILFLEECYILGET